MERVLQACQDKEIDELYSLIRGNPNFFQAFDQDQFADTPLHLAAAHGRTQLALEIQRLMPSFGRKLNPNGFSPVDLALQQGHSVTVSAMIKVNPELVCVQGREGITPLHYVAETGDKDMLAEFLYLCPDSIKKSTIRGESAAHAAVRNRKMEAFTVLLGWLKRTGRTEVLRWKDWEGNTVLHLAASTNQPQVMELLVKEVPVNYKNSEGMTALDIVMKLQTEVSGRALKILHGNRAKSGPSIGPGKIATFADYLLSKITIVERMIRFVAHLEMGVPSKTRNTILLVAALIAGATYQAVFSWPDVLNNQNPDIFNCTSVPYNSSTTTTITSNIGLDALETQEAHPPGLFKNDVFAFFNSIGFIASVGTIVSLLLTRQYSFLLHLSLLCLVGSYLAALNVRSGLVCLGLVIIFSAYLIFFTLIVRAKMIIMHRDNLRLAGSSRAPLNYVTYIYNTGLPSKYSGSNSDGNR